MSQAIITGRHPFDYSQITCYQEVKVRCGLVPVNALVLTGLTNFQVVRKQEVFVRCASANLPFFAPAKLCWLDGYWFAFAASLGLASYLGDADLDRLTLG
jgi:hypothetical protein